MKSLNPTELSKKYMEVYNDVVEKYHHSDIQELVDNLNEAIKKKDMKEVNEDYSKILDWNFRIANIEGARKALNIQFSYLHLPSPMMFTVVYDEDMKQWKFNA